MTATTRARSGRALVAAAAAVTAAIVLSIVMLLPPRAIRLSPGPRDSRDMIGSLHIHTTRSDGTGTVEEVADAAAKAGLDFVVTTDHGNGTRAADPPRYVSGVLCVDAVEIGTTAGHYIALGLKRPAPYPLGGEPRDVVEDVRRLGGFGIAAHPESPKRDLRWREWAAPIDAIEWLNADSEWRDEPPRSIARALATYFVRSPETIASLLNHPSTLARWDALSQRRRVIALAGHDAHARIGLRGGSEPSVEEYSLRLPSYAAAFRTFAQRVRLDGPATGDAGRDAQLLLRALAAGRTYTVIDGFASGGRLTFEARTPDGTAHAGDDVVTPAPVTLSARVSPVPAGVMLVLIRDGRVVLSEAGPSLAFVHQPGSPAVYRVEARLDDARGRPAVPWIVSNPIWIGVKRDRTRPEPPPAAAVRGVFGGPERGSWTLEHDRETTAAAEVVDGPWGSPALRLTYQLAPGAPRGQYAAAVAAIDPSKLPDWDRVRFRASASPEMRISIQVREPGGQRWRRSVPLAGGAREVLVRLDDMTFAEPVLAGRPPRASLTSLLFVVDTTNAPPGARGTIWIDDIQLEREEKGSYVRTVSSM